MLGVDASRHPTTATSIDQSDSRGNGDAVRPWRTTRGRGRMNEAVAIAHRVRQARPSRALP